MTKVIRGRRWTYSVVAMILAVVGAMVISSTPARAGAPFEASTPVAGGSAAVVPTAVATNPSYTPITPVRVADTRPDQPVAFPADKVAVPAGGTLEVPAAGTFDIPADAAAVVANITAAAPTGGGHLRVFPCGQPLPNASALNYRAGVSVANATIMAPGDGGRICVYTPTETHVVVDVSGYFPAGSPFTPTAPVRVADTRPGQPVAFPLIEIPVPAGATLEVPVAGANGIPADAAAIVANVTATQPVDAGHLRVYPCRPGPPPNASTLNYPAGASVANLAIVAPGAGGHICVYTPIQTHVFVDISGYFPAGTSYIPTAPVRVADTRPGQPVAFPLIEIPVPAGATLEVPVAGANGIPIDAAAIVANVTATGPTGGGHLRVFPCGRALPNVSTLNYPAGASVANLAVIAPGRSGRVCIYSPTQTHVFVDINGYFPALGGDRISTGFAHTCAIVAGGQVKCWGSNAAGQLGDGSSTDRNIPVTVVGIGGATAVAAGSFHTCALVTGGQVKCWGRNNTGQLGDGGSTDRANPVTVVGISGATALTAGADHTCAVVADGQVRCWGWNAYGQLGDGTYTNRTTPVTVNWLGGATAVAAGRNHTCTVVGGQAYCWGRNNEGQLGDGTRNDSVELVRVAGISSATAVSAGGLHTCAVVRISVSRAAKCWGNNAYGQLGDGTRTNRITPVTASGASGAALLDAGQWHTCAVREGLVVGDHIRCWGNGTYGQLGHGTPGDSATPVTVVGSTGASSLSAGDFQTCAIASGSQFLCWGNNNYGQVGDATTFQRNAPVDVVGLTSP
ncbi:MAG: hypothetical protein QG597_670 [Actinomycetota bacterium]|nr:hypothetical protein [Actinomycetota bacterium]